MVIQARQKMIKMANTHIIDSSQCFKARASLFSLIELVWTNSQRQTKDDDDERFFEKKTQIVNQRLRLAPITQRIVTNTQNYLYKDLLNNCNFQLLRCFPRNNHRKEKKSLKLIFWSQEVKIIQAFWNFHHLSMSLSFLLSSCSIKIDKFKKKS